MILPCLQKNRLCGMMFLSEQTPFGQLFLLLVANSRRSIYKPRKLLGCLLRHRSNVGFCLSKRSNVMYTIYGLVDPRTNQIRYIGQTSQHAAVRLEGHVSKKGDNREKECWIAELRRLSLKPTTVILEYVISYESALETEAGWIRMGLSFGWPLLNTFSMPKRNERKTLRTHFSATSVAVYKTPSAIHPTFDLVQQEEDSSMKIVLLWVERLYSEMGALHPRTRRVLLEVPWSARSNAIIGMNKASVKEAIMSINPPLFVSAPGNGLTLSCLSVELALAAVRKALS
jgi:hypothetical protein